MNKVQNYTDGIVNASLNYITTNNITETWNHIIPIDTANLGIPLTSSMAVGFTVGFMRG